MKKGNVLIVGLIFVAICIIMIIFIAAIFMSHVNSILYNLKLEMYSINKSAIIAINKNSTSIDKFSYDQKEYQQYFTEALKKSYNLDDDLKNKEALINSVKIINYDIYEKGEKDYFTKERCDNRVIHTVLEVKMTPIIMKDFFEKMFTFEIHEDVNLNTSNELST